MPKAKESPKILTVLPALPLAALRAWEGFGPEFSSVILKYDSLYFKLNELMQCRTTFG